MQVFNEQNCKSWFTSCCGVIFLYVEMKFIAKMFFSLVIFLTPSCDVIFQRCRTLLNIAEAQENLGVEYSDIVKSIHEAYMCAKQAKLEKLQVC